MRPYKKTYDKGTIDERTVYYNEEGYHHREDGPAIEWKDGDKEWWFKGKRHREDGPAVERTNGQKEWWIIGKLHREGGPSVERNNVAHHWHLNGKEYTEEDYNHEMYKINLKKLNETH